MQASQEVKELKTLLKSIEVVHREWTSKVAQKSIECMEENPAMTPSEIKREALLHPETQEVYLRLITLYGCIGDGAVQFEAALSKVADVIPFQRAG